MAEKKGESGAAPFWEKPLSELTRSEWEKLCDGCGRCCLVKLEDEDTGAIHHTSIACKMLDHESCLCSDYRNRRAHVPDCIRLTLTKLQEIAWLPPTCAYVLRNDGKPLPPWHPLISGDPESVHRAGVSVRGKVEASEEEVEDEDTPDFIRIWPKRWPKKARF
ncbi:YcgN family cysteine cluster protein [Methylocystis echinoides]|uniref:YcgN family cysteine cluster protein n=1 Tax=Methylocystis echinoides TaxID=29468 RepID=UPI003431B532